MSTQTSLWQEVDFILPGRTIPPKTVPVCKTNEVFKSVCEKLVEDTRNNLSEVTVHLALLNLQEKFFACFELAPPACRRHMASDKVTCLFHTYRETHRVLHNCRLLTNPIRLKEDPPPPAQITQVINYGEFPIGETVVEDGK